MDLWVQKYRNTSEEKWEVGEIPSQTNSMRPSLCVLVEKTFTGQKADCP